MCRSGCPTQDHESWGACARASRIQWGSPTQRAITKNWDGELELYRRAREQDGLSPKTTRRADTEQAYRMADKGIFR